MGYTKGEWKTGKTPPLSNWVVGVNLDNPMEMNVVANLYDNKDDANLIAAAPVMYEALRFFLNQLEPWVKLCPKLAIWVETARDEGKVALAQAEGK